MAGLLGWFLATFWPRGPKERQSKNNLPLPWDCHVDLDPRMVAGRPVFVVGDVHGCFEELCELLQLAGSRRKDPFVIFVGDIINKGPQSISVLRLVEELTNQGQAACVRGNHEESVLRELWALKMDKEHYKLPKRYQWLLSLQEADFLFLQELPYTLTLPPSLGSAVIVHAGIVPGLPLELQSLCSLSHMRNLVLSDSFALDHDPQGLESGGAGLLLVGSSKTDQGEAWASLWPGPQHVYFGHDARRKLQRWPFATGLDTACLYGGKLTGVFIGPDQEFLSVDAKMMYVEP